MFVTTFNVIWVDLWILWMGKSFAYRLTKTDWVSKSPYIPRAVGATSSAIYQATPFIRSTPRDEDQTNRLYPETAVRVSTVRPKTVTPAVERQEHPSSCEPTVTSQRRSPRPESNPPGSFECQQPIRGASSHRHSVSPRTVTSFCSISARLRRWRHIQKLPWSRSRKSRVCAVAQFENLHPRLKN